MNPYSKTSHQHFRGRKLLYVSFKHVRGYIAKNSNLRCPVSPQKLERPRVHSVVQTGDLAVRHLSPTFPVGDAWTHFQVLVPLLGGSNLLRDHAINDCGHVDPKPKGISATISLTQTRVHCSSPDQTEHAMIWEISSKTVSTNDFPSRQFTTDR